MNKENGAYIVHETIGGPPILCVMDVERETFHTFTLPIKVAARLAAECAAAVNSALQKK